MDGGEHLPQALGVGQPARAEGLVSIVPEHRQGGFLGEKAESHVGQLRVVLGEVDAHVVYVCLAQFGLNLGEHVLQGGIMCIDVELHQRQGALGAPRVHLSVQLQHLAQGLGGDLGAHLN